MSLRLAVLGSGSGSNCQSIFNAIDDGRLDAEVVIVLSDNPDAYILERARQRGVRAEVMDCQGYKNKFPLEVQAALAQQLTNLKIDLVCLAGFMRLVKEPLLSAFPRRILNIHPALLPAFPGVEAWKQALEAGATQAGCTVHYVDAGMDTGEIIMQAYVPVLPDDTAATLHARIQVQEHILYPAAILSAVSRL
ncbi:MAG: phosphoribosylglycinamide formyltransferase [Akkermansia sp.]|nr:phosphoribosylglycinamide formyltransferase [Akkermansia sp.]MBR3696105.1 phosphoribosylglycinamide formyltransferase [Akkermansia sp.]